MNLDDFDPPVLAEKTSAEYKKEIFGDNWERMTPQKLKWLIALSGPANKMYYGKGETRHGPGPGIKDQRFPKKPKKKKTSEPRTGKNSMVVVGPGDEPRKPFPGLCPTGDNTCIARVAKELVDEYFRERPAGQPLSPPLHPKDTQRKRAKMPRLTLGKDGKPVYKAPRPTGTYAKTGKKRKWGGFRVSTGGKGSSPVITQKEVEKIKAAEPEEKKEQPKLPKTKRPARGGFGKKGKKSKKPGQAKPSAPSPEAMQRAEQARRLANKRKSDARSGPQRTRVDEPQESRDYISDQVDEKIIQALYG